MKWSVVVLWGIASFFVWRPSSDAATNLPAPIYSPNRHFIVTGLRSPDHIYMAFWAEEVAERLGETIGIPVPFSSAFPIRIAARTDTNLDHARVVKAQGWPEGQLVQRLVIVNPSLADQEEILGGLCWLLMNRYLVERGGGKTEKEHFVQTPDWLAVGLAQELYPLLKERNSEHVQTAWREGRRTSFAEVIRWEYLPEGRWLRDGIAGLAVGWLVAHAEKEKLFSELFAHWAHQGHIPEAWFAERLLSEGETASLEDAWDEWVLSQSGLRFEWGRVTSAHLEALHKTMNSLLYQHLNPPKGRPVTWADLITEQIPLEKVESLVRAASSALRKEALGRPPEYQEVINQFLAFLNEVKVLRSKATIDPKEALALVGSIERAESSLLHLHRTLKKRAAVMDRWEEGLAVSSVDAEQMGAFLDEVARWADR